MCNSDLGSSSDKFFAAVAGDRVARAQLRLDQPGDPAQHLVAGRVAETVVDPLELVDVEEDARQRMLVAARLADFHRAAVLEVAAVLHAGERVGQADPLQAFLRERVLQADGDDLRQAFEEIGGAVLL